MWYTRSIIHAGAHTVVVVACRHVTAWTRVHSASTVTAVRPTGAHTEAVGTRLWEASIVNNLPLTEGPGESRACAVTEWAATQAETRAPYTRTSRVSCDRCVAENTLVARSSTVAAKASGVGGGFTYAMSAEVVSAVCHTVPTRESSKPGSRAVTGEPSVR